MEIKTNVLSTTPENRETPLSEAQSWVTPNRWFFVRSHYETPEIDVDQWRLSVTGCVKREIELSWEQLISLPQRSVRKKIRPPDFSETRGCTRPQFHNRPHPA